jgi:hypothetical protein
MSTKNTNILTGTTSTGIKFQIDTRVKDDARLLLYLTRMQSKTLDDLAKGQAMMSILELLFGSGEGLEMFFNEVAAKHDGIADKESLIGELMDIFEVLDIKNS